MDKASGKTSEVAAWIIYIVNFIVMIICVLFFLFGIWVIASPGSLSSMIEAIGSPSLKLIYVPLLGLSLLHNRREIDLTMLVRQALRHDTLSLGVGIAVSAVATFIFFISFMGLYGAITRSPFLLFMYAALVFLILLLECALLFYFSRNIVEKGLQDDGQWTHAMRLIFNCCENSTLAHENQKLPWSCCGPESYPENCATSLTFKKDCQTSIVEWIEKYQLIIYSSLAILHIVLLTCSILRRSSSSSHSHR